MRRVSEASPAGVGSHVEASYAHDIVQIQTFCSSALRAKSRLIAGDCGEKSRTLRNWRLHSSASTTRINCGWYILWHHYVSGRQHIQAEYTTYRYSWVLFPGSKCKPSLSVSWPVQILRPKAIRKKFPYTRLLHSAVRNAFLQAFLVVCGD